MGGPIEDKKKERSEKQKNPTNPTGKTDRQNNEVDFDEETVKDQQNKK